MKNISAGWKWCVIGLGIVIILTSPMAELAADQGNAKTPPGQAKKDRLPPGLSKKGELPQGLSQKETLPPGLQKRGEVPTMKPKDELQQAWCLERKGFMNYVLQDNTVCGCLTKDHVVAFVEADEWTKAVGLALHHALVLRKEPGIVVFVENEGKGEQKARESSALASLNKVIEEFKLPVTVWTLTLESKEQKDEQAQEPKQEGTLSP